MGYLITISNLDTVLNVSPYLQANSMLKSCRGMERNCDWLAVTDCCTVTTDTKMEQSEGSDKNSPHSEALAEFCSEFCSTVYITHRQSTFQLFGESSSESRSNVNVAH